MRKALGLCRFFAMGVAFVTSLPREARRGVHQGLDLREGWERDAVASIVVVRALRAEENQWVSWLGEGASGGGGA